MSKQDIIREGIANIEMNWDPDAVSHTVKPNEEAYASAAAIIDYLHSQGVVRKVERELPKNPIKITHHLGLSKEEANARQLEQDCFVEVIQDQMLLAGCGFFEPLKKEE